MGILCSQCDSSKFDNQYNENENSKNIRKINDNDLELPKKNINVNNNNNIDSNEKEEEQILKFDESPTKPNENNNKNDNNNNISNNDDNDDLMLAKARSSLVKKNEEKQFDNLVSSLRGEKSKEDDDDQYTERKNKQFQTVQNPKDLKNKLNVSNKMYHNDYDVNKQNNINVAPVQRRRRKSTTLMENSKILNQLFLAEMSVPVSQEILVQQQKGNPSDKLYVQKKLEVELLTQSMNLKI